MYRIGIDEVGRGPLAGPVVVAAVALPTGTRLPRELGPLRDSKKMTARARARWAAWIRATLPFALSRASAASIDARGIARCANACAGRAYARLELAGTRRTRLDGGLFLGTRQKQALVAGARTEVKADERYPEVMLASILAKESRDASMRRYHRQWPAYGFDRHVGYGTAAHYAALKKHGPCPQHRLTFLRSLGTMGQLR